MEMAHYPVLLGEPFQQGDEQLVGLGRPLGGVDRHALDRQEQAALVAHEASGARRSVLVLVKRDRAQAGVDPVFRLDAFITARARTPLCHCVVPARPSWLALLFSIPVRLGCVTSNTVPWATQAIRRSRRMNCCTSVRTFSLPANTLADEAMPIITGLTSPASSYSQSYNGVGRTMPLLSGAVASTAFSSSARGYI